MSRFLLFLLVGWLFNGIAGLAQSTKLPWVSWAKVSPTTKQSLKKIVAYKNITVYQDIVNGIKEGEGCEVDVAAINLNVNGEVHSGFAVSKAGGFCCGSHGCSVELYDSQSNHNLHLVLQDRDAVRVVRNGIITETGTFIALERRKP